MSGTPRDWTLSLATYAAENADAGGEVVTVTVKEDTDFDCVQAGIWPDGVPITKDFERNEDWCLPIAAGTILTGVRYRGRASGSSIFEFPHGNRVWCRIVGYEDELGLPYLD